MGRGRAKSEWRKPGRRQGCRVLAPERHFIVCEGEKTEPLYFAGMRDALKPEFRNRIQAAHRVRPYFDGFLKRTILIHEQKSALTEAHTRLRDDLKDIFVSTFFQRSYSRPE